MASGRRRGGAQGGQGGCVYNAHGASNGWHGAQPTAVGAGRVRTIVTSLDSTSAEQQQRPVFPGHLSRSVDTALTIHAHSRFLGHTRRGRPQCRWACLVQRSVFSYGLSSYEERQREVVRS